MGECPDWYDYIRIARYLRVTPWELAEQPLIWLDWARKAQAAEAEAAAQKRASQQRKGLG